MKKGFYIHFQGRLSIGVSKKIDMQMEEFGKYYDMREIDVQIINRNLLQRIVGLLPNASIARNYALALTEIVAPDFIYIRRTVADKAYVKFLKEIKEKYPKCKIIVEIFTYPYDKDDFGKWNAWPFYLKEKLNRKELKRYVDRFVTYTDDKKIFGVPTICTINGIDIGTVKMVKGEYLEKRINIIGVAYMQRHHGYERIIEGLKNYYSKGNYAYQVFLYLVGDGPEKKKYQALVNKYSLQQFVFFYSTMSGEDLDGMYDQSDLALASFGMYKLGFNGAMSALKTRECLARGIPIITGCQIDVLENEFEYVKNFPNNQSIVSINDVVEYFVELKEKIKSKQILAKSIREYAVEHVSMASAMQPIIKYIES